MEHSRIRAARRLVAERRDEIAAAVVLVTGQLVVWLAQPGGDAPMHGSRPRNAIVDEASALGGHGLVGMAACARLLRGSVVAGPNTTGGWSVLASLPVAVDDPARPVPA